MRMILSILVLSTALAGSSASSSDVPAAYVSPVAYQGYTCSKLVIEPQTVSMRAATLSGIPNIKLPDDARQTTASVVIIWPAAFSFQGQNHNVIELGEMKGQMFAIEQASIQKQCSIQFQRPPTR